MAEEEEATAVPLSPATGTSDKATATPADASVATAVSTASTAPDGSMDATPEEKEAMLRKLQQLHQLDPDADKNIQGSDPAAAPDATQLGIDSHSPEAKLARLPFAVQVTVVNSLQRNKDAIPLMAACCMLLIEQRLESLKGIDSDDGIAEFRVFEDLKERVEEFQIAVEAEIEPVAATLSLAQEIKGWWTKRHVEICDDVKEITIFLCAMSVMHLTGADSTISAVVSGAKNVVGALNAAREK